MIGNDALLSKARPSTISEIIFGRKYFERKSVRNR